jgi:hypothetical protein
VVAPDFNATLYWASLLNSHLPFFRTQAKFMREVYQMAALEVGPGAGAGAGARCWNCLCSQCKDAATLPAMVLSG